MTLTFTIPVWLLWALGIGLGVPLLLAMLYFAYIGFMFWKSF